MLSMITSMISIILILHTSDCHNNINNNHNYDINYNSMDVMTVLPEEVRKDYRMARNGKVLRTYGRLVFDFYKCGMRCVLSSLFCSLLIFISFFLPSLCHSLIDYSFLFLSQFCNRFL